MIQVILYAISAVFLALVLHELGHLLYYRYMLNIKPNLKFYRNGWNFGFEITPEVLYQNDRFNMLLWGVALGGIVILAVPLFHPIIKFSILAAYLAGCRNDLILMSDDLRRKKK